MVPVFLKNCSCHPHTSKLGAKVRSQPSPRIETQSLLCKQIAYALKELQDQVIGIGRDRGSNVGVNNKGIGPGNH